MIALGFLITSLVAQDCSGLYEKGTLEERLARCPLVRDAIRWTDGGGRTTTLTAWSEARRGALAKRYAMIANGEPFSVACPEPTQSIIGGRGVFATDAQAFDVFVTHVAHALYLDISRIVPWTLAATSERSLLLDSRSYHSRIIPGVRPASDYPPHIVPGRDFQSTDADLRALAGRCDPRIGYRFMRGTPVREGGDLLASTPEMTLTSLLRWFYENVRHVETFGDGGSAEDNVYLARRLTARDPIVPSFYLEGPQRMAVAKMGCHSVSAMLRELAASVNIPVWPMLFPLTRNLDDPSDTSAYGYHSGLVYGLSAADPRVLLHADLAIAAHESVGPSFPEGKSSQPLAAWAVPARVFATLWPRVSALEAFGFMYSLRVGDPGFGAPPASNDLAETTKVGGYFVDLASGAPSPTDGFAALLSHARKSLCPWRHYLDRYCAAAGDFGAFAMTFDSMDLARRNDYPVDVSLAGLFDRAAQCVEVNGGCEALRVAFDAWSTLQGDELWR